MCPSVDEENYIHKHIHRNSIQSQKKNEILPFVTWMNLEGIMLSELSQGEKNPSIISLICGLFKKNKLIDTEN